MLRSISLGRVHPSFAKEGNALSSTVTMQNDTWRNVETRAPRSRLRSSTCVKQNLDSSAFAKEGYTPFQQSSLKTTRCICANIGGFTNRSRHRERVASSIR